jgi:CelD/BcsL family acetyltransferase involved in cellulose biosynthesis
MLTGEIVRELEGLSPWLRQWDQLAVECHRPFGSPGWVLPWWQRAAPPEAALRIILAREGDELVGVAPFFMDYPKPGLARYRLLGSHTTPRGHPMARLGKEREAAEIFTVEIERAHPRPHLLTFDGVPSDSPWPRLIEETWPGKKRPWVHRDRRRPAPFVSLAHESFEAWLSSKSKNFRQQMRRIRRQLDTLGANMRLASSEKELVGALPRFAALHHARWNWRGGSSFLNDRVEQMLLEAARNLEPQTRLRLWSLELEGEVVSSHLFVAAGGELSYWLGGFDDKWSAYKPALQTLLAAMEHAWHVGDERVDLGGGREPYKYRLADGEDTLQRAVIVPPGTRSLPIKAEVLFERMLLASRDRLGPRLRSGRGTPDGSADRSVGFSALVSTPWTIL